MLITHFIPNGKRMESHNNGEFGQRTANQWRDLFTFHREALSSVARILTDGPCSPAVVLFNAESKIKDRDIAREFRFRYAIRAVVLAALIVPSLEQCPDGFELFECGSADLVEFENRMAALPRPERHVIFLREMLGYSKRETGLLLGIGDSRVDDLLYLGRNRLLLQGLIAFEGVKPYFDISGSSMREHTLGGTLLSYA